jgi:hypothetical protein
VAEISQFFHRDLRAPAGTLARRHHASGTGSFIVGRTTSSFVTPDDFASEADARFAAEKIIRKLQLYDVITICRFSMQIIDAAAIFKPVASKFCLIRQRLTALVEATDQAHG